MWVTLRCAGKGPYFLAEPEVDHLDEVIVTIRILLIAHYLHFSCETEEFQAGSNGFKAAQFVAFLCQGIGAETRNPIDWAAVYLCGSLSGFELDQFSELVSSLDVFDDLLTAEVGHFQIDPGRVELLQFLPSNGPPEFLLLPSDVDEPEDASTEDSHRKDDPTGLDMHWPRVRRKAGDRYVYCDKSTDCPERRQDYLEKKDAVAICAVFGALGFLDRDMILIGVEATEEVTESLHGSLAYFFCVFHVLILLKDVGLSFV